MMTLEEAIDHCEEVAEINEDIAYNIENDNWMAIGKCQKCAEEHRQLAEWLRELKKLREQSKTGHWTPCKKHLPDKELKTYWVCLDNGEQCQCRWTNNIYGFGSIGDIWGWKLIDLPQYTKVVAWRELPESYKEIEDAERNKRS